jgi:hypothetical protein
MKSRLVIALAAALFGCNDTGPDQLAGPEPQASAVAMPPGLLAYYHLNGSARDAGPNGYHGTVIGARPARDRHGYRNRAYAFDGDDRIELGDVLNEVAVPYTVAAWVRFNESSVGGLVNTDVVPPGEEDRYYGVGLQVTEGELRVHYTDGGGVGSQFRRSKQTALAATGEWVHVAGVVRGVQDMSLYVNGQDAGGYYTGTGGALAHNDWPALLGNGYRGVLDEVAIFGRALTAEEILTLYNRP